MTGMSEFIIDSFQRNILFLDVLRRRGNEQEAITSRPMATVLSFEHEIILSGHSLPRPINYSLAKIIPPAGTTIKPGKPPVIIVDPRAGQGPGIGGFKRESEIGVALAEGYQVYFVGFSADPVPGQSFLDVVEGQVSLIERVVALHPDSPRPIVFGNCQAGYQTFMGAMLRPELYGTIIMAGSPVSYWQGVHGKNPMRYAGGLMGGSWLTALASDLENGKFDGANLIANFDNLNPANFLWSKQYDVYANIDTESQRYLGFEKWWGDFIQLNGPELQYLVDQLFIGNKLTSNELVSSDGRAFDPRGVTAPTVCLTSIGDNISPPQQALGWILDIYHDVEEISARGRTIVYCVDPTAGHLAIFVSAKVADKEDAAFVRTIDMLECLPPGLYEMIVTPKAAGDPGANLVEGDFIARFEPRTLDDIRAFGRNSVEDDRAFETAARLSETNLSAYRTFVHPFVQSMASEPMAEMLRRLNPLRLSYTMFADSNPAMRPVKKLAEQVLIDRKPAARDNPFLLMQEAVSEQIVKVLDFYRELRDSMSEAVFFALYSSPILQAMLGTNAAAGQPRQKPGITPADYAAFASARAEALAKMRVGGKEEATVRALLFVLEGEQHFDERVAAAFREMNERRAHWDLEDLKRIILEQAALLHIEKERAIESLPILVPKADDRKELIKFVTELVDVVGPPDAATKNCLERLTRALKLKKAIKPRPSGRSKERRGKEGRHEAVRH
jgi:pimeloyl-ACP methyl ester carboxylesterase